MDKYEKTLLQILRGTSDQNIEFIDVCLLLDHFGFDKRIRGSHHIFSKDAIEEIINIQPNGKKAKPYQVKQIRNIFLKYKIHIE